MKKLILMFACFLLSMALAIAQNTNVSGIVVDENDDPVIGASVIAKGTTVGTLTDVEGKFSLSVPASSKTLLVRYIGMKDQEVAVGANLRIVLQPATTDLDEVLVVAYGTARKSTFTGSASVIKGKDIAKLQTGNVSRALEGAAAGVQVASSSGQPGTGASVRIRGIGSINASTSPLYVVDGVPFQGNINTINSMDIESMTVLKDAAANSLYGSRASNGVILITTKKGVSGMARVTLEARYGVNSRALKTYDVMDDPAEFYEMTWEGIRNRQFYSIGNSWLNAGLYATNNLIQELGKYNNYDVPNNELIDPATGKLNPNARLRYREDWEDAMFENGNRQEYVTSISGGDSKMNYYLSLGYLTDEGYVVNSDFERYSSRLRLEKDVNDWLRVGATGSFVKSELNYVPEDNANGNNMFFVAQTMAPIYPVYLHDMTTGDIILDAQGNRRYDFGDDANYARPVSSMTNPVASQYLDMDRAEWTTFNGHVFSDFKWRDFKLTLNYAIDESNNLGIEYMNGLYGQFRDNGGIASRYTQRLTVNHANQLLTWMKEFGGRHTIDILAGHEHYVYRLNFISATKEMFLDPDQRELSGAIKNPLANSYETNYRVESYLSRVQYNLDEKYYLSASLRNDGSSKFHKDNRWGTFWSMGASWRMSKENFLSDVAWIDDLKFKASYGTQGNDQIGGVLAWADQYAIVNNNDNISLVFSYKGNKDITWESSNTFNTGFEFNMLDQRLYGGIEYFYKKTTDMLYNRPTPSSFGISSYPDNIGDMLNQGIELEITGVIVRNNDWEWNVSFNATHFKNEITKLPPERKSDGIADGFFKLFEGKSRYEYYMREYAGVSDMGEALWYADILDVHGEPTGERTTTTDYSKATDYFQGTALPDFYGGIGAFVKYKGIDLSVQTSYQVGGKGYDYVYSYLMSANSLGFNMHKDVRDRWTPDHTETDVPRVQIGNSATSAGKYSSRWFVNSSFFNLRNITIGYELPRKLLRNVQIESLRIYGVADNVALFSKRQGYDPRTSWSGSSNVGQYSPIRTISVGLNLTF